MAKLVYGLNQSLDGYVNHDHEAFLPDPVLFRHFVERMRDVSGSIYGRRMYETMNYWDEDRVEWGQEEWDFAKAWRDTPKWVVSRSLNSVGPNASLIAENLEKEIARLKSETEGYIEVAGPELAGSLTDLGLVDEYHLYLHPVVLGSGTPFFAGPRSRLRPVATERIGEDIVKLTYAPI